MDEASVFIMPTGLPELLFSASLTFITVAVNVRNNIMFNQIS